jgi:hypothetical protein
VPNAPTTKPDLALTFEEWVNSKWKKDFDAGKIEPPPDSHAVREDPANDPGTFTGRPDQIDAPPSPDGPIARAANYSGNGRYICGADTYLRFCPIGQSYGWVRKNDTVDVYGYSSGYMQGTVYGCMQRTGWMQEGNFNKQ